jgi:hypothetical protein
MGLLRRAGLAAVPPRQADASAETRPSRGGLLGRSLALLDEEAPPGPAGAEAPRAAAPEPISARDILVRLQTLHDGVELPSHMFGVLQETLGIVRGALLLYDPVRMVYAPWASRGFDQTTLHRLRIPLGAVASFTALSNGSPVTVGSGPDLAQFQRYFSSREFASLSGIVLAPFIADGKLVGALLVAEASPPFDARELLASRLAEVCGTASPAVHRARRDTLSAGAADKGRPGVPLQQQVQGLLAAADAAGAKMLLLSVSLEAWSRGVLEAHPYLDPFRLGEDLRHFLGAFAADLGAVLPLPDETFLIALQAVDPGSLDLVMHQLTSHLVSLFGTGKAGAEGITLRHSRLFPDDGTDAAGLVSQLTSPP